MAAPDIALWSVLRARPGGLEFRRQHPIDARLALDFYCDDARLAVAIDGEPRGRPGRDVRRDAGLEAQGIATLRVRAVDCRRALDAVVRLVIAAAGARLPLHHASHGSPSRAELGED